MSAATAAELVDAEARHAIATDLGHTLFVEAGAGTGKTTALVERVVELVRTGTPLRDLAAITFTEAAAAELRHRLRRRLEAAARDGVVPAGTVDQLDDAAICTLHAFAERMLAQFPIEAGLPPAFEVLDEVESAMALSERFGTFLDELFGRPELEGVLLQALTAGFRPERLLELAAVFHDHRDRLHAPAGESTAPAAVAVGPVIEAIDALLAHVPACTKGDDKLLAKLVGGEPTWEHARAQLLAAAEEGGLAALRVLATHAPPRRGAAGAAKSWPDVQVVKTDFDTALQAWTTALDDVRSHVAVVLTEQVRQFTVVFAAERATSGRLVFHDLLVAARDLLRDHPDVRDRLRRRWRYLLIDEFQDTDPLQIEIAVLLGAVTEAGAKATTPHSGATGWTDVALDPGRLFFVGDAKQSIYRFRRADIALYDRVRDQLDTTPVALTTNFRSAPALLAWVNEVFAGLLADPEGAGGQAEHQRLDTHRPSRPDTPAVRMLGTEADAPLAAIRAREAAEVAATIVAARDERWPIGDGDDTRPAGLRDIAVLVPTRTVLPYLEDALVTAGVPYRVDSASLVWSTQIVRDLLSILRVLADPADPLSVVGALRTTALACSDRELASWHRAGGRWALDATVPEAAGDDHPVALALHRLASLGHATWWASTSALVDRVAHELPFFELAAGSGRARDQWRQLRFVIEQARAFEERPEPSLRRFLAWAELQASDEARIKEPALPEDDHDAVRISTIHGAKGLEFPVTIVCGLNVAPRGLESTAVMWVGDQPAVRLGKDFCTPGFREAAEHERTQAAHERRRLLYVAMTRARDHLVVSLHRATRGSDAAELEAAWQACDPEEGLAMRYEPLTSAATAPEHSPGGGRAAAATAPAGADLAATTGAAEQAAMVDAWLDEQDAATIARAAAIERLRRAPVVAATAVLRDGHGHAPPHPPDDHGDELDPGPEAAQVRRGRAGTAIGRAVHAVLQEVDLADPADLDQLAEAHAEAERLPEAASQVAALARAAIGSDLVRTAIGARHWRELYVAAPVEGTVVEGFIDLLYDDGTGLTIVDHKTDAIDPAADLGHTARRYRHQLASYALVLEATTGRPVHGAALLFVAGGVARPVWIDDLPEAKAEVVEWLRGRA